MTGHVSWYHNHKPQLHYKAKGQRQRALQRPGNAIRGKPLGALECLYARLKMHRAHCLPLEHEPNLLQGKSPIRRVPSEFFKGQSQG